MTEELTVPRGVATIPCPPPWDDDEDEFDDEPGTGIGDTLPPTADDLASDLVLALYRDSDV